MIPSKNKAKLPANNHNLEKDPSQNFTKRLPKFFISENHFKKMNLIPDSYFLIVCY